MINSMMIMLKRALFFIIFYYVQKYSVFITFINKKKKVQKYRDTKSYEFCCQVYNIYSGKKC